MYKKFVCLVILFFTLCACCSPTYAVTSESQAKSLITKGTEVAKGNIRLCVQASKDACYISSFWKSASAAKTQCTRGAFSMAMSYLGIDCTPLHMQEIASVNWESGSGAYSNVLKSLNQENDSNITLSTRVWGQWNLSAINTAIDRFTSDSTYSPILIWGHYNNSDENFHSMVLVGKAAESDGIARYIIIDPSSNSHSNGHVGWMDVDTKTGKSTARSSSLSHYSSYRIERVLQWHDENASPTIGNFDLVAEIQAVVTTRSDKGITEYKLQDEPYAAANTKKKVAPGTDLTTTGVYKNKHGNYWLRFTDGTYLCANDVKLKTPVTAPETSGLVYPKGNLTFGEPFDLKGTIKSKSTMPEVWAAVYKPDGGKIDDTSYAVTAKIENVKSVDIYTSALNKSSLGGISFSKLAKGDYYFTLWAYYYTYQDVEKTSENPLRRKQAVFLVDEPFTVGSGSSSTEEVNDAVDLCTLNAKFTYNKDANTHKLPYAASTKMGSVKAGQTVTVTKLVQNRYNNIWAQLSDGSYMCFYDKTTGEHHMTFLSTNELKVSDDLKKPTGDIPLATSFGLRGTITADMPIYSVTAKVTNRATEDVAVGPVTATSAKGAFTKSVTMNKALNGVNINDKMSFKKLTAAGYYRYEVVVQLGFIYAFDGEVFQFGTEQVAISSDFTAGNPEDEELLPDVPDEPTLTRLPGDANDDAVVDIYDALLILQYDAGWNVSLNTSNADVNADNSVDIYDALLILQYGAGWNVVLK